MTPGQEALIEAARLETARVYGGVVAGTRTPVSVVAAVAEAVVTAAKPKRPAPITIQEDPIDDAIRAGYSTKRIIDAFGVDYAAVRAARKRVMGAA